MYFSLEAVLHLAQLRHDLDGFRSARGLLHDGVVEAHKDVVFLVTVSQSVIDVIVENQNHRHKLRTFSSAMVNLPVVTLLFSAKSCRALTGSLCSTEMANWTLAFVYSWPGCIPVSTILLFASDANNTHVDDGVVGQGSQTLVQGLVHLGGIAFKEPAAS